jgi:Protein of unknown function (DUF3303)
MLYMVIERFKNCDAEAIGERFKLSGRMMPEGIIYHASWVEAAGTCCYQIMETSDLELLKVWMSRWEDLVVFEIVPILTSADFWAKR